MAIDKKISPNIDNSSPGDYPHGAIRDNTGVGDGTPVNKQIYGDLHEFFAHLMDLAAITYNNRPDNTTNGYQLVDAARALAGKNDLLYTITGDGSIATVSGLKLGILLENEIVLCRAAADYDDEDHIKGSDATTLALTVPKAYKANEYVRLLNTSSGVTLLRLADAVNLNTLVSELSYLKAATDLEEITGTSTTKATTPHSNLTAFEDRVTGDSSGAFLATTSHNGLLSKDDKTKIDGFVNTVKNIGWFSGFRAGGGFAGDTFTRSGNIVSATLESTTDGQDSTVIIVIANAMANTNYFVRTSFESQGTIVYDNNCTAPVFKPINTTSFRWSGGSYTASPQSLKVHLEVIQL